MFKTCIDTGSLNVSKMDITITEMYFVSCNLCLRFSHHVQNSTGKMLIIS